MIFPASETKPKQCKYVKYEHVRWGVETGVMIGGASPCYWDAIPGEEYCWTHRNTDKEAA